MGVLRVWRRIFRVLGALIGLTSRFTLGHFALRP
jgi:hypothetical protein